MTPYAYIRLYKGVLGEVVGKFILEKFGGLSLHELPDEHFELFDFVTENDVHFDFKNWFAHDIVDTEKEEEKIRNKMEKVGTSKAIIINIVEDASYESHEINGILKIPALIDKENYSVRMDVISEIVDFITS